MAILRKVECDINGCGMDHTEQEPGSGWHGWGQLKGVVIDGKQEPMLCPYCLSKVATFIDTQLAETPQ